LKAGAADYVIKSVGEDFFSLLGSAFEQAREKQKLAAAKEQAEEELRQTNARLETLLKEVNHRVANSLQLVSAFVHMQSSALPDEAAKSALQDTQRRIQAIAQVHRRLYTGEGVDTVAMDDYLAALVAELQETWSTPAAPRVLTLASEPIRMKTDRAVSLGVIVNELVSNACKYAYSGDQPGEVRIALTHDGEDRFLLKVEDDGCGITPDTKPKGTGLGTKVIRAMAQSLQAKLHYDMEHRGVRAILSAAC
jgi:two-component sensor histidine kinase